MRTKIAELKERLRFSISKALTVDEYSHRTTCEVCGSGFRAWGPDPRIVDARLAAWVAQHGH